MKLNRASLYAIQAIVYLADKCPEGTVASHDVARVCGIPERFLLKVLKPLVSAGVLHSLKGPHGGYRLAKPAKNITLLDIIEAVDGPIRGQPVGSDGVFGRKLEAIIDQAADTVCREFRKVRVADLTGTR